MGDFGFRPRIYGLPFAIHGPLLGYWRRLPKPLRIGYSVFFSLEIVPNLGQIRILLGDVAE